MQYGLYNDAPVIRTYSGLWFNCFDPQEAHICITDIAHALSMQPRFGGHLPVFYSVAEHSIRCCEMAQPKDKLAALMHDASEAYIIDVPRPIKKKLMGYADIENNIMNLIAGKFGFEYPMSENVKQIDEAMLQMEWSKIMIADGGIIPLSSENAKIKFIELFHELNKYK